MNRWEKGVWLIDTEDGVLVSNHRMHKKNTITYWVLVDGNDCAEAGGEVNGCELPDYPEILTERGCRWYENVNYGGHSARSYTLLPKSTVLEAIFMEDEDEI